MKSLKFAALAALVAALALPGVANAYPKQGYYVGLAGGIGLQQDSDATIGGIKDQLQFSPGFAVSGDIGYGFENQLRPEFEIAYRKANVNKVTGPVSGPNTTGNYNSIDFMGNLFYDFDTHTGLTPYVGIGAGIALTGADNAGTVVGTTLDSQETLFAYQGIAGLSYEISERLDATADYRYFSTLEPEFHTAAGGVVAGDTRYAQHTFMVGLRYIFGVPKRLPPPVGMRSAPRPVNVVPAMVPPMMPVVQAPPAPPPPAVPETYIVFFDFDKYYLTSEAKETLNRASDAFKRGGVARVEVTGHTDTMGTNRYNQRLSERRARVVREYMVASGIPDAEISTRGAGERELMVPTANQVREAKNRRAEIVLKQ